MAVLSELYRVIWGLCRDYIGFYGGYIGIVENEMETTTYALETLGLASLAAGF